MTDDTPCRRWEGTVFTARAREMPAAVPHPEPEVRARPALPFEIPVRVRKLCRKAQAAGWTVQVIYSRGTLMGADGRVGGRVVVDLVVSLRSGPQRAAGVWQDGSFSGGFLRVAQTPDYPFTVKAIGARELAALVSA